MTEPRGIEVRSIVGLMTKEPLVEIRIGKESVHLSPDEARDVALNLFECSQSAICDLFLCEFAMEQVGMEMQEAAMMLKAFREWRQARESAVSGETAP
jgi:hypothetical protein